MCILHIYYHVTRFQVEYHVWLNQKCEKQKKSYLNCVNHENFSLSNLHLCDNEEGKGQEFKQLTQ